jgi:biofilm PGA synthesis N-glycosyltransferase PgaC
LRDQPTGFIKPTVTIGLPSFQDGANLQNIFKAIAREKLGDICHVKEIIVVTPTPHDGAEMAVREALKGGLPITLMVEGSRRGKWAAINKVREASTSELILLMNADTLFLPGSLRRIIQTALANPGSVVGARPTPDRSPGFTSRVSRLLWSIHHRTLSENGVSHASGELMAVPRSLLGELPADVINDDAYIAQSARLRGARILYEPRALVVTRSPRNLLELFQQRRRILEGHIQLMIRFRWRPMGVVFTILEHPQSIRRVITALSRPGEIPLLFMSALLEALSLLTAIARIVTKRRPLTLWPRYPPPRA